MQQDWRKLRGAVAPRRWKTVFRVGRHTFLAWSSEGGCQRISFEVGPSGRNLTRFVDLLLTWNFERKKPPLWAALKLLIYLGNFGCGDRI